MRSSVAFALICVSACWSTIATADDTTPGAADKPGKIVATAPRNVDTTHGLSTAPDRIRATTNTRPPPALSATANIMLAHGERYKGYAPAAAGVTAAFSPSAGVAVSRTGIDRAGAVAGFGGVQTATVRPMGAVAGNLPTAGVRSDATTQPDGLIPAGGILNAAAAATWKTGLTQGVESTNAKATVLANLPTVGALTQRLGVAPRAVNVRNRLTGIGGSTRPIRNKH